MNSVGDVREGRQVIGWVRGLVGRQGCRLWERSYKRKVIQTSYNIQGQTLAETSKAKYLGVTTDNKPSWNSDIDAVTRKASKTTAFLRRNLLSCTRMSRPNATRP